MRVFVTGASGWIGSAVVPELINTGHQVVGLARSDASAAAITAAGAEPRRGALADLDSLRSAAAAADGVIHLAFQHDIAFTGGFAEAAEANHRAVETFGEVLAGSGKPFVIASGLAGILPGRVVTEQDGLDPGSGAHLPPGPRMRRATELLTLSFAASGVRSSAVRFAPTVHGDGDHGFMATLVGVAREKGVSGYLGDGSNRWPAVHRFDAAHLVRLALEQAPAGSVLHGVAEQGVPVRDIAEVIGRRLGLPVAAIAPEDAAGHFGWLGGFIGIDAPASSAATRELLGWHPVQPGLLDDLDKGHYFHQPPA
jgi:nucleoside-diphosphate-sugar epimerase